MIIKTSKIPWVWLTVFWF